MIKENAGYTIIKEESYTDNYEIVLGQNMSGKYVTWEHRIDEDSYFWGHYFEHFSHAIIDYHRRLLDNYKLMPF